MLHANDLSPILPAILTSLLDADKDIVHVVSPHYSGLTSAFISQGFRGCFEGTADDIPAPERAEECSVFVGIVPPPGARKEEEAIVSFIRRSLASSVHKLYLVVFHNVLFSNRIELRSYRKELLRKNAVEASIMLPERLLPYTALGVSILVLDNDRSSASHDCMVNFIDASGLDGKEVQALVRAGKREKLRDYVRQALNYTNPDCVSVDARDLILQDASLLASAHCLTDAQKKARSLLENFHTVKLGDVVHFFRPLLSNKDRKGEKLNVLNVAQFSSFGYTKPEPQAEAYVEHGGKTDQLIQPGDVLLCIRGSLGKVAIASDAFSTDDPWIASSASIILRPARKEYDPRLLFLYLRSELGQELLKKLACGATVPMVQMKDLKQLEVVIPPLAEAESMLRDFEEEVALSEQMEKLERKRRELAARHWSLSH
ncbi:type I restriction-modification system subunit M/S [uncultured Mailhella sp.]|uniref:restriction endonuclease subunit S n=1 Tax=uncultured Mailhella sp. TaxID=1981031 RepID=UPI0025F089C7|nr:type I restriction-modification system subunit M/S [uncultured Mailhella sp.]